MIPYMRTGDLLAAFAGIVRVDGGTPGSPSWAGLQGAPPVLTSAVRGGAHLDDLVTGRPEVDLLPSEAMDAFYVHPAHLSFYHGRPGSVLALESTTPALEAPRPFTRVRHSEGPYDYLFTDVMFALDPSTRDKLSIDVTRQTVGTSGIGNPARFANARVESWDAVASYRRTLNEHVVLGFRDTYNDNATWQNGGALPWRDDASSPWLTFPSRSTSSFIDTAFNPLLASYVNPTMVVKAWRNEAMLDADVRWDTAGAHRSVIRLQHVVRGRRYSDLVDRLEGAELTRTRVDRQSNWNALRMDGEHYSQLAWASLTLGAALERYAVDDLALGGTRSGVNTTLSAMLTTDTGPVHLQGAARADHVFGSLVAGIGGSARLSLMEGLDAWAGISASDRPASLFERHYTGARVIDIGVRSTASDRIIVTEAGATWDRDALRMSARAFANEYRLQRRISVGVQPDTDGAGALRLTTVFDNTPEVWQTAGGAIDLRYEHWGFEFLAHAAWTAAPANAPVLTPRLAATTSLAWRGSLIEGTLAVRAGAAYTATSTFDPTRYNPEADWFGIAPRGVPDDARSYTNIGRLDLFLFATIKQSATLHLVFVNVLDDRSIQTSFHPMPDRGLRFGVDWVFFE